MTWPFENDTSAITRKIASAKLKHDLLKKRLSILAIALATMLMTAVLLLIAGIITVNANGGHSITGSYHALITEISREEFEHLKTEEQVELTGLNASIGNYKVGDNRLNISYSDSNTLTLNGLSVARGKMPVQENEILIEKEYLEKMNPDLGIGDKILLTMPDSQENTFIISGYLKTPATGTNRTLYAAMVSKKYFDAKDGWNKFFPSAMIRINTDSATSKADIEMLISEILEKAEIKKMPSINEAYITLVKPPLFMIATAIAGLSIIMAASVLVIYCIFYISIINSIEEYGQLRTIGMTGRQIRRLVFREGFILSAIAIPIGLVAGTLPAYVLVPQGFQFTNLIWVWPLVAILIYITVRLSIRKPAIIAATVSPIDAYRYTASNAGKETQTFQPKKISPVMLAKKHISRYRKKNILTITSLVFTGILLLALSSVLSSINARDMALSGFPRGQFIITISNEEMQNHSYSLEQIQADNPLTDELRGKLMGVIGAETITDYHYLPALTELQSSESNIAIVSFRREDIDILESCSTSETDFDYDNLAAQNQLIIGRPDDLEKNYNIHAEPGQTLTLKIFDGTTHRNVDFEIATILDQSKIGNNGDKIDMLMLPLDSMNNLVSSNTTVQYAIRVSDDFEQQAEAEITQILKEIPALSVSTLSAAIAQNSNFIQGMKLTLAIVVVFIGCFAVINFMNTILTGILTRQKEFALMRSVGMSQKQLFSMVCCESMITTAVGLILSLMLGGGIGNALCDILKNEIMIYLNYQFPFGAAAAYCAVVILCTLTITGVTLKHQNKLSLIEQLQK